MEAIEAARRALGTQLAAYRKAADYTQLLLADSVGYSRSTIANVETGRQHVPPDFWRHCDAVLGTGADLATAGDEIEDLLHQRRQRRASEAQAERRAKVGELRTASFALVESGRVSGKSGEPESTGGLTAMAMWADSLGGGLPSGDVEEDQVERRALLQLLALLGAGTTVPVDVLEKLRDRLESTIGARDDTGVDEWERIVWEYGCTIVRQPAERVIADLTVDIAEVRRRLGRTQASLIRAGLMRVTAQLSALMADELHSLGMFGPTWRWWRTARHAADQSADRDLRVRVRAREAINAFHSPRPTASVLTLTDQAVGIAGGASSAGLAEAHKQRAYVFMGRGEQAGARAALSDMKQTFEGLPAHVTSDTDSVWGWSERIVHMADSYVYTSLGTPEATSALEHALALYPPQWWTEVTRARLFQAVMLVRDRDIGGGLAHALSSIESLPDDSHRRRPSIRWAAKLVQDTLPDDKARTLPAARELQAIVS